MAVATPRTGPVPGIAGFARRTFVTFGLIPILLVVLIIVFASIQPRFLDTPNIVNMARQGTYLALITMGQMLYLLTRNYDLSNGSCVALTSVVTALVMTWSGWNGDATTAIVFGCLAGLAVGLIVGLVNGIVVAYFRISSFMVTLGMSSMAFGAALILSNASPITGLPLSFVTKVGIARWFGIPVPVFIAVAVIVLFYLLLNWTKLGRHAYAIGGNEQAARVSGVAVQRRTIYLFMIGSGLASVAGVLLTARISSGDPNIGSDMPLQSISAAVLGGVSLFGGEGRVSGAIIGAIFIVVLQNGMDLVRIESYVQLVVLGGLLVIALIVDRLRMRLAR
jgi:ribose transport system permease protein